MIETNKIPKDWIVVTLGQIATYVNGKAFKPSEWSKEGLPIIRIQNLNQNNSSFNYCNFSVDKKFYVNNGDLLFAWSGTPDTSFGAHIWHGGAAVLNQHIFKIIVNDAIIVKKYYLHALNQKVKEFIRNAHGTAGLAHITKSKFEESEIPLPPLPEQHRIVAKIEDLFSSLDKGIESLITAQQQLKVYRQAVLKWAFEGKLTNENVKEGELPEGWKFKKISEISTVVRGGSPRPAGDPKYYNGNIPFLKVADLTKNNDVYLTEYEYTIKKEGLHKTREIKPDTLLLSNSGATLGVPKICKIYATMNDGVAAFLNLDQRSLLYLYYFWLSKTKELRNINQGAAQPNLNTEIIKNYQIPFCSFEEQQRIVSEIETRLSVCDKLEETMIQSLSEAEALRQSILKKAFEGKLVPQDPNDEPASVLLDHIRRAREENVRPGSSTALRRKGARIPRHDKKMKTEKVL